MLASPTAISAITAGVVLAEDRPKLPPHGATGTNKEYSTSDTMRALTSPWSRGPGAHRFLEATFYIFLWARDHPPPWRSSAEAAIVKTVANTCRVERTNISGEDHMRLQSLSVGLPDVAKVTKFQFTVSAQRDGGIRIFTSSGTERI